MNRPIICMMVTYACTVLQLVSNISPRACRKHAPLHGKAMQGKQHQQKDAKITAHRNVGGKFKGNYTNDPASAISKLACREITVAGITASGTKITGPVPKKFLLPGRLVEHAVWKSRYTDRLRRQLPGDRARFITKAHQDALRGIHFRDKAKHGRTENKA